MKENVINTVVANGLCVGCGMCTYMQEDVIEMKWNESGFLVPHLKESHPLMEYNLELCPFNPKPDSEVKTEDEIAALFLQDAPKNHRSIGRYANIYAGYSEDFRTRSSSGGIATFVFTSLLESGAVDHVISVRESTGNFYEYAISSSTEELLQASKTRYYPVTLATVLPKIKELPGTVAVSGVACFIKAIRLAQHYHPELRHKIKFLVGIICGGLKSSFFTDYLASRTGVEHGNFMSPEYRIKDYASTAYDYSFGCIDTHSGKEKQIKMKKVGDMWGSGLFKAKACDFCDDVTTELADISLGDAWIHPYARDGAGTSVIVTRSAAAENLIQSAMEQGKLSIHLMPLDEFLKSQSGSFNHRQKAQPFRIKTAMEKGEIIPPKRFLESKISFPSRVVQTIRQKVRAKSLVYWPQHPHSKSFDSRMKKSLLTLRVVSRINQKVRKYLS